MSIVATVSGELIDLLHPSPDLLHILDIANGLAMLCRFAGQLQEFYSVAQHSVFVSRMVPPEDAMWGLLHDASEAYIADLPGPLKSTPMLTGYRMVETGLINAVAIRFGLPAQRPASVKEADRVALATEFRDLRGCTPEKANALACAWPAAERICPVNPQAARSAFLARFNEISAREKVRR